MSGTDAKERKVVEIEGKEYRIKENYCDVERESNTGNK